MDSLGLYSLDEEILDKYKQQQTELHYTRTVEGNSESVGYLPGSSVRFWLNDEPSEYAVHWHPAIEMVIPLENKYTVIVGQETYELTPGDIFVIPGGELHHLIAPPSGRRLIYLFEFNLLSRIRGFSFLTSYLSQPVLINRNTCRPIFTEEADIISQLCRDYFQNDSLREMMIYSKLLAFFVNYVRYRVSLEEDNAYTLSTENRQKDLMDKFNTVFDYLDEHFAEDLTLEKVADVAGFSKFHFSRLFKQCSGYNFYDYLCYKRIKSAEMLLLKPGISITEVALQSGFSSLSTFNRTFKKTKGCTPSEYRSLYSSQLHAVM
ncbi:MAG: helix-turn-helix domain-containing protein [Acetatifactor sp.]